MPYSFYLDNSFNVSIRVSFGWINEFKGIKYFTIFVKSPTKLPSKMIILLSLELLFLRVCKNSGLVSLIKLYEWIIRVKLGLYKPVLMMSFMCSSINEYPITTRVFWVSVKDLEKFLNSSEYGKSNEYDFLVCIG